MSSTPQAEGGGGKWEVEFFRVQRAPSVLPRVANLLSRPAELILGEIMPPHWLLLSAQMALVSSLLYPGVGDQGTWARDPAVGRPAAPRLGIMPSWFGYRAMQQGLLTMLALR